MTKREKRGEWKMNGKRGFTLIELLTVIVIISVLAAILLPVLNSSREKGRQAVCQSNLKQIFLAMEMYKNENGGYYPLCSNYFNYPAYPIIFWTGAQHGSGEELDFTGSPIYQYLKVGEIKTCPGFKQFTSGYQAGSGGYGYNKQFIGGGVGSGGDETYGYKQRRDAEIEDSSETVILSDCASLSYSTGEIVESYGLGAPYYKTLGGITGELNPSMHFRHNGFANVVWCDGHISSEKMSYSKIMGGRDHPAANIGWIGEESTDPVVACKLYGEYEP